MKTVRIRRHETSRQGTFGTLSVDGLILVTGELPDLGNAPGVSCIPAGIYPLKWLPSAKFGRNVYHVQDVPGRTAIEIHSGNYCGSPPLKSDVEGCILLGQRMGVMSDQDVVLESRDAVKEFEDLMAGDEGVVEITNEFLAL